MGLARRSRTAAVSALVAVSGALLGLSMLVGVATASPDHGQATTHSSSGTAGTSGTPSSPQPQSTADMNSGGANGQCPGGEYCSTRHGAASGNGNGNGKATGKPCAGCVGRADNKNPRGQETASPRAVFPNNGYECDNNNGIGRTNPAHTGCASPSTTGGDCVTNPPAGGCSPSPGCIGTCSPGTVCTTSCSQGGGCLSGCSQSAGGTVVLGETASKGTATRVLGERVQAPPAAVGPRRVTRTPSALPFTGAALGALLAIGALVTVAGSAILWAGRARRRTVH